MKYVKASKQSLTSRLLEHLSVISTAPAMTYPLLEEQVNLPSLQASAPLLWAFHRISSTRAWSTSRAMDEGPPKI
jgi:hypothetical protein